MSFIGEATKADVSLILGLIVLALILCLISLMGGPADLGPIESIGGLLGLGDERSSLIVQEIRFPRTLVALLVGGTLGLAGAALQGLLRNPLADPGVLGVTTSAGLGAIIAIYYGLAAFSALAVPVFAMGMAGISTLILWRLAKGQASILTLILSGVALNALAAALISLMLALAPTPHTLADMVRWMMGSLSNRSYSDLLLVLPFMIPGGILLLVTGQGLRGLSLGDDVAETLGVDIYRTRGFIVFGSALMVGAAVSVAGAIGFVGLVVPHLIRPLVGHDPGRTLVPSAIAGGALLLAADCFVRWLPMDRELNIGVVTALLGAPFFLWLIIKTRREML